MHKHTNKITIERDSEFAPCCYILCKIDNKGEWDTRDEENTRLIQSDFDYPNIASTFGWVSCCGSGSTDGTIDCPDCGKTASELIDSAREFLDNISTGLFSDYIFVDDPGYFN